MIKARAFINRIFLNITLDAISTSRRSRSSQHRPKVGRKEARKQSREEKKRRKAAYFSSTGINPKRLATSPHPESPPPKKRTVVKPPQSQRLGLQSETISRPASKNTKAVASSSVSRVTHPTLPTLPRSQQEEEEDRYIALLEEKLTSGKRSKNGPGYVRDIVNDGLGGE